VKLWDTNVVSELARREPDAKVLAWVETETSLAISAVTVDELFFGLTWRPCPRISFWLESFLMARCEVLAVTSQIARLGGELRAQLRTIGKVRTQADIWIAATAQVHGLTLVTRNVKDFEGCNIEIFDPFLGA
jgi:predicted nucleic acid-binding protein